MNDKQYNGWTNYETWNVALWLDNEQGSQEYCNELAHSAMETHDNDKHEACCAMGDRLKEMHEENTPEVNGVYADLLNAALSEVNWYEIAGHYVNEVEVEAEEAKEVGQ